jgi:hypothetical protein
MTTTHRRRIIRVLLTPLLAGATWTTAWAQPADPRAILADPAFASTYRTQYGYLTNTSLAVLTEELRGVLEDVASGGSRVGSTPAGHRARSFERVFLRQVQDALCAGGAASRTESIQSTVVRSSAAAGNDSGLALTMAELGRFSAIAVRAVERSDRAQLCRSATLSELAR